MGRGACTLVQPDVIPQHKSALVEQVSSLPSLLVVIASHRVTSLHSSPITMALYFKEQDIDEFRDCFYLKTKPNIGYITSMYELKTIMRSLGMSPTESELNQYFKEKDGKITFADLLDIMHTHSVKEKIPQEILDAFIATDSARTGQMSTRDLRHILCTWGEKLDQKEFDKLMREANIYGSYFKYEDFVKIISAPIPDY